MFNLNLDSLVNDKVKENLSLIHLIKMFMDIGE